MQSTVYHRASGIIAISKYTAIELLRQFPMVDRGKIHVIYHGLPVIAYPKKSQTSPGIRIISIGQWIDRKGFDLLIDSVRRLTESMDLSLDIVTDSKAPTLTDSNIRIHIDIDEDSKKQLLANADVFVLANRHIGTDFEGLGYVILEAMQAGLPCIVGQNGGPAELIRDGVDGFVVDPESNVSLDQAICTLSNDANLRATFGKSAKTRALSQFSEVYAHERIIAYLST